MYSIKREKKKIDNAPQSVETNSDAHIGKTHDQHLEAY